MKNLFLIIFCLLSIVKTQAQPLIRENKAIFNVNKDHLDVGGIQYGLEWLTPYEFNLHPLKKLDLINEISSDEYRTKVVVAKLVFVSQKSFDNLSLEKLSTKEVVQEMFDASFVENNNNIFKVWSTARAYGFNFQVSYNLVLKNESNNQSITQIQKYFKEDISLFQGSRTRVLKITMNNFSRLMNKNESFIYMKELPNGTTFISATVISTLDSRNASLLFPFGKAESVMLRNMQDQILSMSRNIQKL